MKYQRLLFVALFYSLQMGFCTNVMKALFEGANVECVNGTRDFSRDIPPHNGLGSINILFFIGSTRVHFGRLR